jgi:hypothetical protein
VRKLRDCKWSITGWEGRGEDKKTFGASRLQPSLWSIKDRVVLGHVEQALNYIDTCGIYGVP